MKIELTPGSIDIVATKEAFLSFAVATTAGLAILAIGGLKTAAGVLIGVLALTVLFARVQKHLPERKRKWRIVIGGPRPTAGRN